MASGIGATLLPPPEGSPEHAFWFGEDQARYVLAVPDAAPLLEAARAAGVAGWVRNNPDGSVELEAGGPASALARLRDAVQAGPAGARVEGVEERPAAPDATLPFPFMVDR